MKVWTEDELAVLHRRANELWDAAGRPPVDPLQFVPFAEQEQIVSSGVATIAREETRPAAQAGRSC